MMVLHPKQRANMKEKEEKCNQMSLCDYDTENICCNEAIVSGFMT